MVGTPSIIEVTCFRVPFTKASRTVWRQLLGGWLLCVALLACGGFDADVRDLQARTVPGGARLVATSPITRDAFSATATWEVGTPMGWDEYLKQVRERLIGFKEGADTQFTKTLAGDDQILRLERLTVGPPLRVRVTLRALAG